MNHVDFFGVCEKMWTMLLLYSGTILVGAYTYINNLLLGIQISFEYVWPQEQNPWKYFWRDYRVTEKELPPGSCLIQVSDFSNFCCFFFFLNHKRPICSFSLKRNIIKRIFSQEEIMTSLTLEMLPYGFYFFNLKIAMRVCACVCVACVCVCVLLGQGV